MKAIKIIFLIFFIVAASNYENIIPQDGRSTDNDKLIELLILMGKVFDYQDELLSLLKKLNREGAIGEYEIANGFRTELSIARQEMRHFQTVLKYKIYLDESCNSINIKSINEEVIRSIDSNIDFHIRAINVGLELDIRNSIYKIGSNVKYLLRDFRQCITEWDM